MLQRQEKAMRVQDPVEKREEMERMREHIYNTQDINRGNHALHIYLVNYFLVIVNIFTGEESNIIKNII